MPGPAVRLGIWQGAGHSAVHRTPLVGRGVAIDGRPGERMPELYAGITHRDEGRGLGGNKVGEVQIEHWRGAG